MSDVRLFKYCDFIIKTMKSFSDQKSKTIRISDEIYQKLAKRGNLVDSFNSVIANLLQKESEKMGGKI